MDGTGAGSLLRLLLMLCAVRAECVGVRLLEHRTLAVPGRPVTLGSELGVEAGERLHSISWRVEREGKGATRILQHVVGKNTTLVSSPYRSRVSFNPRTGSLRLLAFTRTDRGLYRLTATAADGAEARDQGWLDVYEPVGTLHVAVTPNWTSALGNVTLSCQVEGGSDIHVRWDQDDRNVTDPSRLMFRHAGLDLLLPSLGVSECGAFTCTAWNLLNRRTSSLYLTDYLDMPQCRSVSVASVRIRLLLLIPALLCFFLLSGALACSLTGGKKELKKAQGMV